jgi:exodeoxyribonuclease VII large subunit
VQRASWSEWDLPPAREVYTVSRLNREVRAILELSLPLLWVEGELSNLSRPSSGHWYFSLKDGTAQVRCAMFRHWNRFLGLIPENGMHVLVRARVSLYEGRGEFQLVIEHLEEVGDGALRRAFEALSRRLQQEGLFAPERKRLLPWLPRRLGVITSPSGAAIHDILTVMRRRFPAIPVLIYPVPVQGSDAAERIAHALRQASRRKDCDVLILARGGGSLEDLQAFNTEEVARALYECEVPVVTGIGHEIDFTIADLVADCRAPTPSAAAERVSPDQGQWQQRFVGIEARLIGLTMRQLDRKREQLLWLEKRLQHPGRYLLGLSQRLDELERRLQRAMHSLLLHRRARLAELAAHIRRHNPLPRLREHQAHHQHLSLRLHQGMDIALERARQRLAGLARSLEAVSPLSTLSRGYAIVQRLPQGTVVYSAHQVHPGDQVEVRLAEGRLVCDIRQALED